MKHISLYWWRRQANQKISKNMNLERKLLILLVLVTYREFSKKSHFHSSIFSDCPALAPASSYGFMCKYSAVNIRKILLKFAILEKLRDDLSSPILCHSLGNGTAIKCRIGTPRLLNGMWSSSIPAGRNPLWKMRRQLSVGRWRCELCTLLLTLNIFGPLM